MGDIVGTLFPGFKDTKNRMLDVYPDDPVRYLGALTPEEKMKAYQAWLASKPQLTPFDQAQINRATSIAAQTGKGIPDVLESSVLNKAFQYARQNGALEGLGMRQQEVKPMGGLARKAGNIIIPLVLGGFAGGVGSGVDSQTQPNFIGNRSMNIMNRAGGDMLNSNPLIAAASKTTGMASSPTSLGSGGAAVGAADAIGKGGTAALMDAARKVLGSADEGTGKIFLGGLGGGGLEMAGLLALLLSLFGKADDVDLDKILKSSSGELGLPDYSADAISRFGNTYGYPAADSFNLGDVSMPVTRT